RPSSQADLEALQRTLRDGDEQERSRAATRLLDWPQARSAWPAVLEAFLGGTITLPASHLARLGPLLVGWPEAALARQRAQALWAHCQPWQHRAFVRDWVEGWLEGDATLAESLRGAAEELLLPHCWAAVDRGDARLLAFLRPSGSPALRALIRHAEGRFAEDVEALRPRELEAPPDDAADPVDPIAGRGPDELLALAERPDVAKGLAVRAVHALVAHGEHGVAPLERLVTDRRAPVRSAALRSLRRVR